MAEQAIESYQEVQPLVPPEEAVVEEIDILTRALMHPIDIRPVIGAEEQHALTRRESSVDIPQHIATTLVLRWAGLKTSIVDYDAAIRARGEDGRLRRRRGYAKAKEKPSLEAIQVATETEAATAAAAAPYVEVYGQLGPYADRYRRDYGFLKGGDRERIATEIYNPTDGVNHPLLGDADTYRTQRLGNDALVAGRILRLVILDRIVNQKPQP